MEDFRCHICAKGFGRKTHLEAHLKKKVSCDRVDIIFPPMVGVFSETVTPLTMRYHIERSTCVYCKKTLATHDKVVYHIKHHCKIAQQLSGRTDILTELNSLRRENANLKAPLASPEFKDFNLGDTIADYSHLKQYELITCGKAGYACMKELAKLIYRHPKLTTIHNVYIHNITGIGMYYNQGEWKAVNEDTLVDNIYRKIYNVMYKLTRDAVFRRQIGSRLYYKEIGPLMGDNPSNLDYPDKSIAFTAMESTKRKIWTILEDHPLAKL